MWGYAPQRLTLPDPTWGSNQSCYPVILQTTFKMHDQLHPSKYFYTLSKYEPWRCELENWLQDPILQNLFPVIPQHTTEKYCIQFSQSSYIEFPNKYAFPIQGILHLTTKQDLKAYSPTFRCGVADPTLFQWADLYNCTARSFKKLRSISPHFHQLSATSLKGLSEVKFDSKRVNIHIYH